MRKVVGSVAAAALAAALVVAPIGTTPSAEALSAGLGFTADDLPTWQANGTVWAIAAAGDVVFAGGTFSELRPPDGTSGSTIAVSAFASFDATTGQPASCRPAVTFSGGTATVRDLEVSPDGKTLYIAGNFSSVGGVAVGRLAALDIATCTVKTNFRPNAISSTVRGVSVTNDTVYFAGDFLTVAGQDRQRFAAVTVANASLLPWVANADVNGYKIEAGADGSVALGGDFFTINGQDSHGLAIVDGTTGDLVKAFPRGFIPDTSVIRGVTSDETGYYFGAEGTGGGVFDGSLAIDYGSYAQRWRDLCLGATQSLLIDNGIVYEANHHHDCAANKRGEFTDGKRIYLTANTTDVTNRMLAWNPLLNDGLGEQIGPRDLAIGQRGSARYLWVSGEFTRVNDKPQQSLTRFANGPDTGAPSIPSPVRAESLKAGQIQVSWRSSFDSDDGHLTYTIYRGSSTTPIATVEGDSRWWWRPQVSWIDTSVTPGQSYSYRVRVSDGTNISNYSPTVSATAATADQPYAAAVLNDGATLYWRYNEASGRHGADSSTGNRSPQYMQAVTYQSTSNAALNDSGSAMAFDGSTAYAYSEDVANGPTTYSVETWFRTTTTRGGKIVGFGDGLPNTGNSNTRLSGSYDRHVYMLNNGRLAFGVYTGSAQTVTTTTAYNDGQWHHVVATQGATGMTLYVDGLRVGRNGVTTAQGYQGSWRVGGDNLSGWPSRPTSNFFAGDIDETAVYPTVLSIAQVRNHYTLSGRTVQGVPAPADAYGAAVFGLDPDLYWRLQETSGSVAADSGPFGVTGTYSGRVTPGQAGVPGITPGGSSRAANFNPNGTGNNNGGVIGSDQQFSNPRDYSLELWFQSTSTRGGKLIGFGSNKTTLSSNYDRHVYLQDDGKLVFGVWTGSAQTITTPGSYNDGAWHHVVATQSSTAGLRLYVDGALVGSNPETGAQDYAGYWKVGGDTTWGSTWPFMAGRIDEVAVYGRVLTLADVALHYSLGTGATPPDLVPPTAPASLTATLNGDDVDLAWSAATDDTGVAGYEVHRGAAADFTPTPATKITQMPGTTFTDVAPEPGTHYYKVVALDAAGNASPASPVASATILGPDVTPPSVPSGLQATVTPAEDVTLSWSASTDDRGGPVTYDVHRGASADFTPSPATLLTSVGTTSYTDLAPAPGTYYYKVVASDQVPNASEPSAAASATILGPDVQAPSAPTGVAATLNGTSVLVSWQAATDDRGVTGYRVYRGLSADFTVGVSSQVAQVTGTSWTDTGLAPGTYYYKVVAYDAVPNVSDPSAAASVTVPVPPAEPVVVTLSPTEDAMTLQSTPTTSYGSDTQLAARGSGTSQQQSFLKFALPAAPAGTVLSSAVLSLRTSTDSTAGSVDTFAIDLLPSATWSESSVNWNNRPTGTGVGFGSLAAPTAVNTPYQVTGNAATLAAALGGNATLRIGGVAADNARFWSQNAPNASYRPLLTLTFTPGAPPEPDTEAPSVPTGVGATLNGTSAVVSWQAANDNVGVIGYRVYRGASAGFTANSSSQIAQVVGTSYTDAGLVPGTYYYKVVAFDAVPNFSGASAAASVTVPVPPAEPVVVTLNPTEDAMVLQSSPTTNYGSDTQLAARGSGTSQQQSFLKFALPVAPAGLSLTSAVLSVRTSTDSTAGSPDSFAIDVLTGVTWSQDTVTWNNRPTVAGVGFGVLVAPTATNTPYQVSGDPSSLAALLGGEATLRLGGTAADNVRLWSQNAPNAAYRPSLVLTFSAS